MFCPNCGLQQADATNFCLRCGADLTKKRENYVQIAAGASPLSPPTSPTTDEPRGAGYTQLQRADGYENTFSGGIVSPPTPPASRMQATLHYLGLRRLCCFPTFLACLTYGIFSWLSHYEELISCFETFEEPSFGWKTLAAITALIAMGLIQALIGMGTLYSWQALSTAFVMSAACAVIGFRYTPWGWETRLTVFGVFALCAVVEAAAVIGPHEKEVRRDRTHSRANGRRISKVRRRSNGRL